MLTGLTNFLPEEHLTMYDNMEFLIRIILSGALGILIGLERTKRQKEAGIRTHCIIACSAAVFMIVSKYAFVDGMAEGVRGADQARIAAQVVSGISFLGAGVIFKHGNATIRGLTTAAGMWATSAVGLAIGAGMYWVGLFETAAIVGSQLFLHRFPVGNDAMTHQTLLVWMEDSAPQHAALEKLLASHQGQVMESSIQRVDKSVHLNLTVRLEEPFTHAEAMAFFCAHPGVEKIEV